MPPAAKSPDHVFRALETLDRRWIFLVIFIVLSIPCFVPVNLPIRVHREVQDFYDAIEALEPGDVVYYAADYDPGSTPELDPMMRASLDHLFRKGVKVVGATLWAAGPPLLETGLNEIGRDRYGKQYGVDYVNLGFKEGKANVMVQLGKSIRAVYPADYYGTPVEKLPLLAARKPDGDWAVDDFQDVKLLVNISVGFPGTKEWVQQVRSRYNVPIISGCTAVSSPEYFAYYQSGQLSGLMGGLAGAAQYEKLLGHPAMATKGMGAQSLGHATMALLILFGNALYFAGRRRARRA